MTNYTPRGYSTDMKDLKVINRLNRVEGQLKKLKQNIQEEQDCAALLPQFLAVKGAIAGAFEVYVKTSLEQCTAADEQKMKELITLLIRT